MRCKTCLGAVVAIFLAFSVPICFGAENDAAPSVFFPETYHEFSPVLEDTTVVHDFVIQNKGNAMLNVDRVKTGWGCTAVSFTRQIPAGGEGKITLKVDTKGYGGRKMKKTASVYSNDKNRPRMDLIISGQVEKFVTIRPKHINLRGYTGDIIKASVSLIPEKKYPFKILKVSAKDGNNIKFQLKEVELSANGAYELKVENLKQDTGRYFDTIILETDSKIRPQLNVRVYGNLRPRKSE